jgi:DNA ligase D-like protein (predicted ligase)
MLAEISKPFDDDSFLNEIKFDGTRCIGFIETKNKSVKFLNRRLIFFEDRYPELKDVWRDVNAERVILDGEVVVFKEGKPEFYLLAEREHLSDKTRVELLSKINPATYVVFDILHLDGKDLIDLPLIERKKILEKVVKESERILLSNYVIGNGKKFFTEVRKRGLEGIMAKRLQSTYQVGKRSGDWLKIKALQTLDCVICAYTKGEGKREKYFGALLCGIYHEGKLRYIGRVGTGWSEENMEMLTNELKKLECDENPFDVFEEEPQILEKIHWVKPQLTCEVKFMNLSKDLIMRAPSFVRLREDKNTEECILEI